MKKILLLASTIISLASHAQDETVKKLKSEADKTIKKDETDTSNKAWKKGGIFSLNVSQGSLSNWAAGGDNFSLSLNTILSAYAFYKRGKESWDNTVDVNFGLVNTTSLGTRKNDDRFDLWNKYGHALSSKWDAAALFNFRTQFANGYTYSGTNKTYSSTFLAPAYLLVGVGLNYKPTENFSVYLSPITARWVIVDDDTLSAKGMYGVTPGSKTRSEVGAFLSAQYLKSLSKTINYKGRLDLFSNYEHNPQKVDVFMTNLFSVKLSKVLAATWNVDLIYDDDVRMFGRDGKSPAWQVKSLVGLGILLKF